MRRIWRVLLVMTVALVLGGIFIVRSDKAAVVTEAPRMEGSLGPSCLGTVGSDPAHVVGVETEPATPETRGTIYRVLVERDGRPVSDARVCLVVDMPGMNMEEGHELAKVAPGRFEASLDLPMAGRWVGEVRVAVPGRDGAVVPVSFDVG